jgi:hypothetical protein
MGANNVVILGAWRTRATSRSWCLGEQHPHARLSTRRAQHCYVWRERTNGQRRGLLALLRPKAQAVRGQALTGVAYKRRQKKYESPQSTPVAAAQPHAPGPWSRPAARSAGASCAAPLAGIWQHEQVQTAEQEQGEREQRQEAHPARILPPYHGDAVDDDAHRKGNGQPAVSLPNPFVPVQWDLLVHDF